MNDLELERIGPHAAESVRAEATAIAHSESALTELLASVDGAAPTRLRPAPPDPGPRRPIWVVFAAAAAIIAVVAAVALVNRGDDAAPAVSTDPTLATVPPIPTTVPTNDGVTTPAPTTEPAASPSPTTTPTTPPIVGETVEVADTIGAPTDRRVLATFTKGDGADQLGFEECQECEPVRPWAPVVTPDGAIVVADAYNQRWQVYRDGAWTSVPYADGMPITGSPVVGPDGLIYALRTDGSTRHVAAYDPVSLDLVAKHGDGPDGYSSVDLVNGQIQVGGETIVEFDTLLGRPTWEIDWDTNAVTMAISGVMRQFQLPGTWLLRPDGVAALDDGSIVLHVTSASDPAAAAQPLLLHLWADGTWATSALPTSPATTDLDADLTPAGLVQLEDGEIAEYAYPEFAGADPLAGWTIPESIAPTLDDVPRLMPAELPGSVATLSRGEYEGESAPPHAYSQVWVRTDDTGTVDGFVEIQTRLGPMLLQPGDGDVDLPGWQRTYFVSSGEPIQNLTAHTVTRTMNISTSGLSREDVVAMASTLEADADGAGWSAPALASAAGWTRVAEGWASDPAMRGIAGTDADGTVVLEVSAGWGQPNMINGPGIYGTTIELTEIDGHRALVFDAGHARAITWSPQQGLVVVAGYRGSAEDLMEIAESLDDSDPATWESIPVVEYDGCSGLFC